MTPAPLPEAPTPQAISALLRKAGFPAMRRERDDDPETGFFAFASALRDNPSVPVVVVTHHDHGQHDSQEAWSRHLRHAVEWLSRYAVSIDAAGWDADLRGGGTPRLRVTARTDRLAIAAPEGSAS